MKAIFDLHRVMHGEYTSAIILRAYWQWIQRRINRQIWQNAGAALDTEGPIFLFYKRIQSCLDKLHVTIIQTFRKPLQTNNETRMLNVRPLPSEWMHIVAATHGGLYDGLATEGAVAVRSAEGLLSREGVQVCEWAGRLCNPVQEHSGQNVDLAIVVHFVPSGVLCLASLAVDRGHNVNPGRTGNSSGGNMTTAHRGRRTGC